MALLAACGGGGGDTASAPGTPVTPVGSGPSLNDTTAYSAAPNASLNTSVEAAAITKHTISLSGQSLAYTATAGHLTARDATAGTPLASMFYAAYTLDGAASSTRPLVFFYNGGPGSASVWLHLGSFGPRRLVTSAPSTAPPQPYLLVDNSESLLDVADLVFVDAVSTGYSQAVQPSINSTFWGVDADAEVMRRFIARYIEVNQRGASPVFIFGESYGTTRSGVLAQLMVASGMRLDGVVLLSSVLDYNSNCSLFVGTAVSCAGYLPSYGMTGAWFSLVSPAVSTSDTYGDGYAQTLRSFADATYAPAVSAFLQGMPASVSSTTLANLTGAPATLWGQSFNLGPDAYRSQTLAGQLMGRYDARVAVLNSSPLAAGGDPSSAVINGPYTAARSAYFANELQYTNASTYTMLSNAINNWNFSHDGRALPDTIPDIAAALIQRPALAVLSLNGYHDMATPFHQTELDLERLGHVSTLSVKVYPGGHMTYLDDASRPRMKADVAAFIHQTVGP